MKRLGRHYRHSAFPAVRKLAYPKRIWLLTWMVLLCVQPVFAGCGYGGTATDSYVVRTLPVVDLPNLSWLSDARSIERQHGVNVLPYITSYASGLAGSPQILFAVGEDYRLLYARNQAGTHRQILTLPQRCLAQFAVAFSGTALICENEQGLLIASLPSVQNIQSAHPLPQRSILQSNLGYSEGGVAWDPVHQRIATLSYIQQMCQVTTYTLLSPDSQAHLLYSEDIAQVVRHAGSNECSVYNPSWSSDGQYLLVTVGSSLTTGKVVALKMSLTASNSTIVQNFPLSQAIFGPTSRKATPASWRPASTTFAFVASNGRSILTYNALTRQEQTVFSLPAAQSPQGQICDVAWVPTGNTVLFGLCGPIVGYQEDVYLFTLPT